MTETDLDTVLDDYEDLRSRIAPLVSVAALGTGAVALVVLLMAGGLAADRRRAELGLLRARGASLPGSAGRLLAETAVVAVPAGALGLAAALWAVPHGRSAYAVAAAGTVTLLACLALPVRAAARHRTAHLHTGREDVVSARPSRRRTVAELTLLVRPRHARAAGRAHDHRRMPLTLELALLSSLLRAVIGVGAGVVAAVQARPGGGSRGAVLALVGRSRAALLARADADHLCSRSTSLAAGVGLLLRPAAPSRTSSTCCCRRWCSVPASPRCWSPDALGDADSLRSDYVAPRARKASTSGNIVCRHALRNT